MVYVMPVLGSLVFSIIYFYFHFLEEGMYSNSFLMAFGDLTISVLF